jgi:hypothetical protein
MVETGHFPSWPRIEMRRPCISSSETLSTVPADRSLLSSPRAGRAHEGRSYSGLRPHLPGLGRVDQMRGLRDPRPLSPDWRHGLWSGPSLRRGRDRMGSRAGRHRCHQGEPPAGSNASCACWGYSLMGNGAAMGLAAGWPARDAGGGWHRSCGTVHCLGPDHAVPVCAVRR